MSVLEIVLILLGTVIFIISFRITAKKEVQLEETKELAKEEIKELVEKELENIRSQVETIVDESINYSTEKAERLMERLSNEKIMAVNEYSDTVMEDIHKTHSEVLFLYDMLNDKQENLKSTATKVEETVRQIENTIREIEIAKEAELAAKEALAREQEEALARVAEQARLKEEQQAREKEMQEALDRLETPPIEPEVIPQTTASRNERILSLYKEGNSYISIAKELGLGVGEVQLVVDLYQGA